MKVKKSKIFNSFLIISLVIISLLACMVLNLPNLSKARNSNNSLVESSLEMKLVTEGFSGTVTNNDSVYNVLDQIKTEYGYENAQEELVLDKIVSTAFGKIYKYNQIKHGLNVFGRGINVSVNDMGRVLSVNGNFLSGINIDTCAALSADDAVYIIVENFGDALILFAELEIYSLEGDPALAYNIEAALVDGNYRIFIDAETGSVLDKIPMSDDFTFGGTSIETTQTDYYGNTQTLYIEKRANGDYYLSDATRNIYMFDNKNYGDDYGNYLQTNNYYKNTTGDFSSDRIAVSAFNNIIKSFDFYADADNIGVSVRGVNGTVDYMRDNADTSKEMAVRAYMHYGKNYENAFYTGSPKTQNYISLVFGDGRQNGTLYNLALALDVIGHEYHHAITDYISGLLYKNASGALNEAYSDIFGALIEDWNTDNDKFWIVGEDATTNKKGLRSIKDPKSYGYPDHTDDMYPFSTRPSNINDQGGVHTNNSIITHVQYKMWKALPQHFTKENIGKLWYSALGMLTANATFLDFKTVLCQTAIQLGWNNSVLRVMYNSFESSGISGGNIDIGDEIYHTVTFKSDGVTVSMQSVLHGSAALAPTNPVKSPTTQYNYTFIGWDTGFDCINDDLTVNAVYSSFLRSYTVTWIIEGENETQNYYYGEMPVYSKDPSKPSDAQYYYVFTDWDKEIEAVSGDIAYTAQFSGILRYYTVMFFSDGKQIDEETVAYGDKVSGLPEPVKSGYTLEGWYVDQSCETVFNEESAAICGDVRLYAKWEENESISPYAGCGTIAADGQIMLIVFFTCLAGIILFKRKPTRNKNNVNT